MNSTSPSLSATPWALECHDLTVTYDRKPVLYGIDCQIPQGTLVGVLGPNGAGKSTFLKAALGLISKAGGYVEMFGEPHSKVVKKVGYVPQRESVDWDFPVNVMDVVLMGRYGRLGLFKRPKEADREIARQSLEKVGMLPYAKRQIANLSGGQQQRVFLARALAQQCDLYLMDEPFAAVDAATERAVIALLREMREMGKTVLVVHHDLLTAPTYFDHLMLLNLRLVAFGKTEDVWTPENLGKTYGGQMTLLSELALKKVIGADGDP